MAEKLPEILEVKEVAEYLQCSENTVRELLRTGKLTGFKMRRWKVRRDALEAYIAGREGQA